MILPFFLTRFTRSNSVQPMNWELLLAAYPTEQEPILKAKALREIIMKFLDKSDLPVIQEGWRENGLLPFTKTLIPICTETWKEFFGSDPSFSMEEILGSAAQGKAIPDLEGVDLDALEVIINDSFSLLFQQLRKKNSNLVPDTWNSGYCPFCGSSPHIAFDSETGRQLFCPMCGCTWRFRRFQCPSCNNTDHNTLGYFEAEGIKGDKIYFCRKCEHYIKVIDQKLRETQDPETEDTLSLEMDNLAVEEGFKSAS
jgi:hypothetical protein